MMTIIDSNQVLPAQLCSTLVTVRLGLEHCPSVVKKKTILGGNKTGERFPCGYNAINLVNIYISIICPINGYNAQEHCLNTWILN